MPTDQEQNNNESSLDPVVVDETVPGNSMDDIADLLDHAADEHNGGETPKPEEGKPEPKPEEQAKPEGGKEGAEAKPQTPKPGEEVKPVVEAKPEPSLKDVLKEVLAETKASEKPQEEAKPEPKADGPKYTPLVPDQIMAAIESEDPKVRQQGVSAMIGGAMNRVYADLKKEMESRIQAAMAQVPTILSSQQQVQEEAKKNHDTFYSENPNFGTSPARKKLVAQTALILAQQEGQNYKGFTPEFAAKLATEIESMTGLPKGKPQPKPQGEAPKPPKPKLPFNAGNSGARTDGAGQMSLADEIADTIGTLVN